MTRPDLDAIRARCEAATPGPWHGATPTCDHDHDADDPACSIEDPNSAIVANCVENDADVDFILYARTDIPALLAYVEELESRVTYTVGETEWAHRIAVAEQRFVDEYDAHQETRTLLTDLWLKQRKADAEQMREYGISYHGVRKVLAEYDGGDLSLGKVVELLRAAAHELAKEEIAEMREECAHLKHREIMLKRAHGALTDAGCIVPLEFDRTIEHAINALAERALTAEERLERVTHEWDQECKVFERENLALRQELARLMDDH